MYQINTINFGVPTSAGALCIATNYWFNRGSWVHLTPNTNDEQVRQVVPTQYTHAYHTSFNFSDYFLLLVCKLGDEGSGRCSGQTHNKSLL